jgi:hypothetical protein
LRDNKINIRKKSYNLPLKVYPKLRRQFSFHPQYSLQLLAFPQPSFSQDEKKVVLWRRRVTGPAV